MILYMIFALLFCTIVFLSITRKLRITVQHVKFRRQERPPQQENSPRFRSRQLVSTGYHGAGPYHQGTGDEDEDAGFVDDGEPGPDGTMCSGAAAEADNEVDEVPNLTFTHKVRMGGVYPGVQSAWEKQYGVKLDVFSDSLDIEESHKTRVRVPRFTISPDASQVMPVRPRK